MTLLASDRFIYIGCHICWRTICAKSEKNMRKRYCHSYMLVNVIIGIRLWPVMSYGFSWMHYHIACGLCREMTWPQSRNMIFRAKESYLQSCEIRAASMLLTYSQIISKWTATILWQIYVFHLKKRSFLDEGRRITNNLWFISTIAQFTQIGLQQVARRTWHAPYVTLTLSHNLASIDFYLFFTVNEKLERIQVVDDD
jgi:hypothetical protein